MKHIKELFNSDGHITDMTICVCSDRLIDNREHLIPDRVRSHLEICEKCRSSVLDIYSTLLTPTEKSRTEVELIKKPFLSGFILRTAATFLILGFITAIYFTIDNSEPVYTKLADKNNNIIEASNRSGDSNVNISKDREKGQTKSSENGKISEVVHNQFKDNPNLEYMVNSHHRGRFIHIISPEFRILGKGKIIFVWENHIDKNLELKILNNLNETLFKSKAYGSRVEFNGNLSPGLYYWKLEDKENLYHVGKFLIEK